MKSFLEYIREQTSLLESAMHFFDIDGTIAIPQDVHVHVINKQGKRVQSLSHSEFNTHRLEPGQRYDFSDFRSAKKFAKSQPIMRVIQKIKTLSAKKNNSIAFNTARADFDNKDEFLNTFSNKFGINMNNIHVHRAGNITGDASIAKKKAEIIRNKIKNGNYKHVSLYDDDTSNLDAFLSLKKEFPHMNFNAHHVDHTGRFRRYTG